VTSVWVARTLSFAKGPNWRPLILDLAARIAYGCALACQAPGRTTRARGPEPTPNAGEITARRMLSVAVATRALAGEPVQATPSGRQRRHPLRRNRAPAYLDAPGVESGTNHENT